ncbi:hypothetical protein [Arthrobacter sp. PAMC 25486]|uniref:hypothetical protein n=1 Tax=Arthrobacter sp. PAMC 25486 TaxID=1494608 RepID=UPI00056F975E|nr:hypothetical protein [Arthrobacter sp. PAMC 25486]
MGAFEFLGISQPKGKSQKRISSLNIGIIIIAIGCVSLVSQAWLISTIIVTVGLLVFIVGAVKLGSQKKPESR